ncbi:phosphoribosyltransferase-like protein [Bacillus massiliigorillae]|uniref:phosphoribosyltransferase-like protein n=1 Tax=Bacillus massiliigorillae TaxID=1243664 RepID=UPI00039F5A2B|nr:hypothetical protein [Bacillus massiliigorillae]
MDGKMVEYLQKVKADYDDELYFKDIDSKYREWIQNVTSGTDKKILNELFYNLRFFSKKEIKSLLKEKMIVFKKDNNNFNTTALLPLTPIDGRYSGSNEMISLVKELDMEEQVKGTRLLPYRDSIINDIKYADDSNTLIFIDDISGTGGTVRKFVNYHHKKMQGKKIVFLFLAVTEQAIDEFNSLSKCYTEIEIEFVYCFELKKLSAIEILSKEEFDQLYSMEEGLWGENNRNILGYEQSELLVLFSHNIPNNTVSSFWYYSDKDPDKWKRLFVRITAPNRRKQNYSNKKRKQMPNG